MTAAEKACTKCGETKPLSGFSKDRSRKDGHRAYCRVCQAADRRRYREANREAVLERQRRYHEATATPCVDCGTSCTLGRERCRPCAYAKCPGGYSRGNIVKMSDRWGKPVNIYLKTVTTTDGRTYTKVGLGNDTRVKEKASEILVSFPCPLPLARWIEREVIHAAGQVTAPAEIWPNGLNGHTECVASVESAFLMLSRYERRLPELLEDERWTLDTVEEWLYETA